MANLIIALRSLIVPLESNYREFSSKYECLKDWPLILCVKAIKLLKVRNCYTYVAFQHVQIRMKVVESLT